MTKSELIKATTKRTKGQFPRYDVEYVVNELFNAMKDALANGDEIKIQDFGIFSTYDSPARRITAVDGNEMEIDAFKGIAFKAAPALKEAVNGGK